MNKIESRIGARWSTLLLALLLSLSGGVAAQQQLSVEELEKYIAEQKEVLEEVRANRDETKRKADEVREALAEQEARKALVEDELDTLCKEQEALKPGSYDACRIQQGS